MFVSPEGRTTSGHAGRALMALSAALCLALCALLFAGGCGGDDPGPSGPTGLVLSLGSTVTQVTRQVSASAVTVSAGREQPACDWYVNDVLGGSGLVGTITQDNPATYTAPFSVPEDGRVTIKAVLREDAGISDSDTLAVRFDVLYVDPEAGNDIVGSGRWTQPLRTLFVALSVVARGDTVLAMPGTYDLDSGEQGVFQIPADVVLKGADRDSCVLYGSGSTYAVVDLGDGATLANVTVRNAGGDQIGVLSTGGGLISNILIQDRFAYTAMRADGSARGRINDVVIEGCTLTNQVDPRMGRGLECYYGSHCVVRDCTISGWTTAFYANYDSDPLVEGTSVTGNAFGVFAAGGGGLLTEPDLGGGARGSAGGNTFLDNTYVGVSNQTAASIWALWNTWSNDPPLQGPPYPADIQNTSGGSIIWSR